MPEEFLPIDISSLHTNTTTAFDLYLPAKDSGEPTLYNKGNVPLAEAGLSRLHAREIETLYIRPSDLPMYRQYTENNLDTMLQRNDLKSNEKLGIIYDSAKGLMSDVFTDPRSGKSIQRSRQLVENTVGLLITQGDVLNDLHQVMAYDYHIYTHSINVCVYGLSLALRSGITEPNVLNDLGSALLLHDVGKSEVDPEILNCPGKLTDEQFDEMKKHTIYGYEILSIHSDMTPVVLDVTLHHHEKLNGHGYPDGLSDEEISKFVRIATIADIFDALTTERSYKSALTSFDALKLMSSEEFEGLDQNYFQSFVQMLGSVKNT